MTDLTKLSEDELKLAIASAWVSTDHATTAVEASAELTRRFAALNARISELEQENANLTLDVVVLEKERDEAKEQWRLWEISRENNRVTADIAIARAEAAEKALGDAYESCRLMEDRLNRLVDQSARVVVLENALREIESSVYPVSGVIAAHVMEIARAALAVRAEEIGEDICPHCGYLQGNVNNPRFLAMLRADQRLRHVCCNCGWLSETERTTDPHGGDTARTKAHERYATEESSE